MKHVLPTSLRRLALVIGFSACLVAPQTAAAQALTAVRYARKLRRALIGRASWP